MIAEIILIAEVLRKRTSTPNGAPSPTPKTVTESFQDLPVQTEDTFVPRPPSKFTGDIQLKKYF